jgi:flagellin FlaB
MFLKSYAKTTRRERGITGIETAIILIAFVVVSSVLAYVVLSAGVFATQKSKEAVYAALEEAKGTVKLMGEVIAKDTDGDGCVELVTFTIANAMDGEPMMMRETPDTDGDGLLSDEAVSEHSMVLQYSDRYQYVDNVAWTQTEMGYGNDDYMLDPQEKMLITVDLTAVSANLTARHKFSIEAIMPTGAGFTLERITPPSIKPVMILRTSE